MGQNIFFRHFEVNGELWVACLFFLFSFWLNETMSASTERETLIIGVLGGTRILFHTIITEINCRVKSRLEGIVKF